MLLKTSGHSEMTIGSRLAQELSHAGVPWPLHPFEDQE
jgi:hypothetical protein